MAAFNALLRILSLALLLTIAMAMPAHAWWAKGHMVIAEIARRNLHADVLEKVQACATVLKKMGPFPQSSTMVELGPWADDLKSLGLNSMATWHFINTPLNPDNIVLTINPVQNVNVQTVIPMLINAITNPHATSNSIATSVANLIHYVGDIHMPLHSTELFSKTYPLGDNGGNAQQVVVDAAKGTTQTLHAFWGSMAEGPQADPERPLSNAAYAALQDFVDDLMGYNSFTEAEMMNTNPSVMAAESFDLAMRNVYPGIVNGTVLTADYKTQAKILSHQRVTLAGYRLATILNSALAGVSLDTINESMKEIQDSVNVTQTGDIFNYYSLKGVERGAAAGIFLSCFAVGCLLAAAVTYAICLARRAKSSEKNGSYTSAPTHDAHA